MTTRLVAVLLALRKGQDPSTTLMYVRLPPTTPQHDPILSLIGTEARLTFHSSADASNALTHFALASLLALSTFLYKRRRRRGSPSQSLLQRAGRRQRGSNRVPHCIRHSDSMTHPQVVLRKRLSPDERASPDDLSTHEAGPTKRRRTLLLQTVSPPQPSLPIPPADGPPTPPSSDAGTATMALKLIIPREQMTREQQRKLKRHRADAERWKPKLERPYPTSTETKNAYPLKLMRHYSDAAAQPQPDFVKPEIDKSPRLSRLLQQFPLMNTVERGGDSTDGMPGPLTPGAIPLSVRGRELQDARSAQTELQMNMQATRSEHARRLAWQSFSLPEHGRPDRGREAMVESGLHSADLMCEARGEANALPEWKRPWTGRFAGGQQQAG